MNRKLIEAIAKKVRDQFPEVFPASAERLVEFVIGQYYENRFVTEDQEDDEPA